MIAYRRLIFVLRTGSSEKSKPISSKFPTTRTYCLSTFTTMPTPDYIIGINYQ